jgi:hypothetical protein
VLDATVPPPAIELVKPNGELLNIARHGQIEIQRLSPSHGKLVVERSDSNHQKSPTPHRSTKAFRVRTCSLLKLTRDPDR